MIKRVQFQTPYEKVATNYFHNWTGTMTERSLIMKPAIHDISIWSITTPAPPSPAVQTWLMAKPQSHSQWRLQMLTVMYFRKTSPADPRLFHGTPPETKTRNLLFLFRRGWKHLLFMADIMRIFVGTKLTLFSFSSASSKSRSKCLLVTTHYNKQKNIYVQTISA